MINKNKSLSIVIPVFNSEKYLPMCVDSIVKTHSDEYEIILVDDGSTDQSPSICDSYAEKYKNIKVVHQENCGVATARNVGLDSAQGNYVLFIDNDDWINEGELPYLLSLVKETDADIIIHRYHIVGERVSIGNASIEACYINGQSSNKVLEYLKTKRLNVTAPWEYIFKKKLAVSNHLEFDPNQNGVDDSCFTALLFTCAGSFYFNEHPLISWRMRIDSQGSTHVKKDFIIKMISSIDTLKKNLSKDVENYKKNFLLYKLYRNIYSLVGPYYEYSKNDRGIVDLWYVNDKDIIRQSSKQSGLLHQISVMLFGPFYGTIISYRLALLKGALYMIKYKKQKWPAK